MLTISSHVFFNYIKAMLNEMTPKIEAVQKMQDYIAAHQTEEINLTRQITALRTLLYPKKTLYKISDCHVGM